MDSMVIALDKMVAARDSELTRLRAEVEELRKAREWRPIATAPKDGSRIMVIVRGRVQFARWEPQSTNAKPRPFWMHSLHMGERYNREHVPTHWQPLPQPPTPQSPVEGKEGGGE